MWMRSKGLVSPRGRMASTSGCTEVLVEGAITTNVFRKPSASVMGRKLAADRRRKTMVPSSLAAGGRRRARAPPLRVGPLPAAVRHARILTPHPGAGDAAHRQGASGIAARRPRRLYRQREG